MCAVRHPELVCQPGDGSCGPAHTARVESSSPGRGIQVQGADSPVCSPLVLELKGLLSAWFVVFFTLFGPDCRL